MPARKYPIRRAFHVNADAVIAGAERIGTILQREAPRIEVGLRILAEDLIQDVIEDAMAVANSGDGFPEPFQKHLRRVVRSLPILSKVDSQAVSVYFDLYDLGTVDDLRKAFHQGARLADGSRLDGPYEGQELANEDAAERHIFWEALRAGLTSVPNPRGPGMVPIPEDASWEATMKKYTDIWGAKAPEWLFIQFGQERWNPRVEQYDILGDFGTRLHIAAGEYLANIVTQEVLIANEYQALGIDVGFTKRGSVRNLGTGRFTFKDASRLNR